MYIAETISEVKKIMQTLSVQCAEERGQYTAKCPEAGTIAVAATRELAVKELKKQTEIYLRKNRPEFFMQVCRCDEPMIKWRE